MKNLTMLNEIDTVIDGSTPYADDFCRAMSEQLDCNYHISYQGEWMTLSELAERLRWYCKIRTVQIYFMGGAPGERKYRCGSPMDFAKDFMYMKILKGKADEYEDFLGWVKAAHGPNLSVHV